MYKTKGMCNVVNKYSSKMFKPHPKMLLGYLKSFECVFTSSVSEQK